MKRIVFSEKKTTDSQYSQRAWKGIVISSTDTTPVPIVTENHEGEKLRTTRRHPTSYFVGVIAVCAEDDVPNDAGESVDASFVAVAPDGSDRGGENPLAPPASTFVLRDLRGSMCGRESVREGRRAVAGIVMAGLLDARRRSSRSSSSLSTMIVSRVWCLFVRARVEGGQRCDG